MSDFKKHLQDASKIVQDWPTWKQEILGGKATMTTLQRLQKDFLILKNQYKQFQKNLLEADATYFWYQKQLSLKQAEIKRHKEQLEKNELNKDSKDNLEKIS